MTDEAEFDRRARIAIAGDLRDRGAIPKIGEVALALGCDRSEVESAFRRMIDGHVFIPRHRSIEILAYNPFCGEPTNFTVSAAERSWWAICAWDALGIPAALGVAGTIDARCADCAAPMRVEVGPDGAVTAPADTVMQVGVPARDFWKNIYHT